MLAFPSSVLQDKKTRHAAQQYVENGGCSLVFSTNEPDFIDKHLHRSASLFYTDFWDIQQNTCAVAQTHPQECRTY